jgi:hypothetical protein
LVKLLSDLKLNFVGQLMFCKTFLAYKKKDKI